MTDTSTKQFVDIQEIKEDTVVLKDGTLRQVVKVGSMNFELKSQDEQFAILQSFKEALNALDFSLEISIISRKLNIRNYLNILDELIQKQQNELLRIQAMEYSAFIKELTQLANIMSKEFFVVIPYFIGPVTAKGLEGTIKSLVKPSEMTKSLTGEEFESYRNQLYQRTGLVIDNLSSLGLSPKVLKEEELANFYYKFYNPEATEQIKIPE